MTSNCLLLPQDHKEALGESEQRMVEFKKENEKEAQVKRRLAKELQFLKERENRSVKEKEVRRKNVMSVLTKLVSNSPF